ncbi:hypothetical protein J8F10_10440 [Gemmata sp. G18]|uniref:SHOCT domain-containing protein n=1 Tax=Gemmata palustris TaxID=2822762 RepID=A0ABS5BPV0_9BACT|nr:hypothetical protein [Gemmata palustris]MBP3955699.1 hypothetical protein [Gemmata palustris]
MSDVISGMTGPQLIGLVAVFGGIVCATVIAVTGIVVPFFTAARRVEALSQLKRDLVGAGFSAEEIERIVQADSPSQLTVSQRSTERCRR